MRGCRLLGLLALVAGFAPAQAAPELPRGVLTATDAVLVAPPEIVSAGEVTDAAWSSDGAYVLAARLHMRVPERIVSPEQAQSEVRIEQSLVLYNARTRATHELFKAKSLAEVRPELGWLNGTNSAFVVMDYWRTPAPGQPAPAVGQPAPGRERWLFRVDAARASMRPVYQVPEGTHLYTAPENALAVLYNPEKKLIQTLKPDGQPLHVVPFPARSEPIEAFWDRDGRTLCVQVAQAAEGAEAPRLMLLVLNPVKGALIPDSTRPARYVPKDPPGALRLRHDKASLAALTMKQAIRPLWLESEVNKERMEVLIEPNARWGRLSPQLNGVLYITEAGAFVAPFTQIAREPFLKARQAALTAVSLSNGKQIGLALYTYASKNGDQLPAAGQPVEELLRPHLGEGNILDGFVYTHAGGKLTDITDSAKAVLGYLPSPSGLVQVFADGHVELKRD